MSPEPLEAVPPRSDTGREPIPVLRPRLPAADRILPYLRHIDASRTYTNWGPLVRELEVRLAALFGVADGGVVSSSSGTSALAGAILAAAGRATPERPLALVPAYTFVATAIAVEQCGYEPYVLDVGRDSWLLDSATVESHPQLARAGVIVPVAAFGRPVDPQPWLALHRRRGIPVVIDGAASFEALASTPGRFVTSIPVALSFHATKTFATGEGGCVVTTDPSLSERVLQALNFGFLIDRASRAPSTNGKMSEYHAAVGLAGLDTWTDMRTAFRAVADAYASAISGTGLEDRLTTAPDIAGCYVLFRCSDSVEREDVQRALASDRVEFRRWYGGGLLSQPRYAGLRHDDLGVTERLAQVTLGLPVAPDLADSDVERVVTALHDGARGSSRGPGAR